MVEPENLHSQQISRSWCCFWSKDDTLRTSAPRFEGDHSPDKEKCELGRQTGMCGWFHPNGVQRRSGVRNLLPTRPKPTKAIAATATVAAVKQPLLTETREWARHPCAPHLMHAILKWHLLPFTWEESKAWCSHTGLQ